MLSICIPSTSKKRLTQNLSYLLNFLEKSDLRKEIELCFHINGEKINKSEIFYSTKLKIKHKISFSLKKKTFQESYTSVVSLATNKYILILGDTDRIIPENLENFLKYLKKEKNIYMTFLFDNNKSSYEDNYYNHVNKLFKLNTENYSRLFKPYISTFIGNVIFNKEFLKYCLKRSYKLETEYPHVYPYYLSLINSISAFYTQSIIEVDHSKRNWSSRQDILNSFDLIRVFSYTIKEISINKVNIKFLTIILSSIKSLPKALYLTSYNKLIKKKYSYPIIIQPIFETLKAYLFCLLIFTQIILKKISWPNKISNGKKNMIAIIGARRYYSVYNSCKNKLSNLIFASDIVFKKYESNFLTTVFRSKRIAAKFNRRTLLNNSNDIIIRFNFQYFINSLNYNFFKSKNHKSRISSYVENSNKFSRLLENKNSISKYIYNFTYSCNSSAAPLFINLRDKSKYLILEQTIVPFFYQQNVIKKELNKYPEIYNYSKYLNKDFPNKIEDFYSQMEFLEWALSDYILCPSDFVKEILYKEGIPNNKLIKLNYGINHHLFKDIRDYKLKKIDQIYHKKKLNVLFIGEFGLRKGAVHIINAFDKLSNDNFSLKVAGNIDINKKFIETTWIDFLGHCSFEKIKEMLKWADIFIMPSLAEGSAIAGSEAICSGVPVISTKEAGISIKHNINGKLIKSRDSDSLYNALNELYEDRILFRKLIINCCKESYKDFSDEIYNEKLLKFLKHLN